MEKSSSNDSDSGDDGRDELRWLGWGEWEEEWGWRNEADSKGKVMHVEISDF